MKRLVVAFSLLALAAPLPAQWLGVPTPGIPRTADGKPNLVAPAPRAADGHADFTGLWRPRGFLSGDVRDATKVQPWMQALMEKRAHDLFKDNPGFQCLPRGPGYHASDGMRRIMQTPTLIAILNDDLTHHEIFMDGRSLEANPQPTWMGYSVGRWEGDTLVVESNGFNDKTWLTPAGLSHTDGLRVTERYRRADFGHLQIEITYTDPGTFDAPLHGAVELEFAADDQLLEIVCDEASEGLSHWVGTATDVYASQVTVAPEILAKYVGTYRGIYIRNLKTVEMTLEDGALFVRDVAGGAKRRLAARSDTFFETPAVGYVFTRDGDGLAPQVAEVHVSGAWVFARVP